MTSTTSPSREQLSRRVKQVLVEHRKDITLLGDLKRATAQANEELEQALQELELLRRMYKNKVAVFYEENDSTKTGIRHRTNIAS